MQVMAMQNLKPLPNSNDRDIVKERPEFYKIDQSEALNILRFENGKPIIVQENLDRIFSHRDVKNRKIVVFSIIGAYRKGKSFFLNYCLRYLYANVSI